MKKLLILLTLILTLAMASSVLAVENISSISISAPAASASIRDTVTFTASWIGVGNDSSDVTNNITFYNDTEYQTVLCTITDLSVLDGSGSCTASTTAFADDCSGHTIFATLQNGSDHVISFNATINATQTGIIFDNTNATQTALKSDFDSSTQQVFEDHAYSFTSADNCVTPTSYVELTKPDNIVVNKSGTSGTWRTTDVDMIGSYSAAVFTVDVAGGKTVGSLTFNVKGRDGNNKITTAMQQTKTAPGKINNTPYIVGGFLILMMAMFMLIGYYYYKR